MSKAFRRLRPKPFKLQLDPLPASFAPNNKWSNKDMDPTPPSMQTWSWYHIAAYWISDAFNIPQWQLASAFLTVGLGFPESMAVIVVGMLIISIPMTLNGYIGAYLHVPFPVVNRSSFGFFFAYFPVVSRVVLACFWFGVQTTSGGQCVREMVTAIWPSFRSFPNHLPLESGTTSKDMLCYFLYWSFQFPFLFLHPTKIKYLFVIKSIVTPTCGIALMCWAFAKTGGGPIMSDKGTLSGSSFSWAFLSGLNVVLGNWSTLSVNIPDFTRYSRTTKAQLVQPIIIPIAFTFISFLGISVTSASKVMYGTYYWNPLDLIAVWGDTPGERAARFFCGISFLTAALGTNIAANSISAGNDFNALMPRYLNIRRGSLLCAFIGGWILVPWQILASAPRFLSFAGGYTIFLGPIAGIMSADFFIVKRKHVSVPALYRPHSIYYYTRGINWRAAAGMIAGMIPCFPGFVNNIEPSVNVGEGAKRMFTISYLYGYFVGGLVYWLTSYLWPATESLLEKMIWDDDDNDVGAVGSSASASASGVDSSGYGPDKAYGVVATAEGCVEKRGADAYAKEAISTESRMS